LAAGASRREELIDRTVAFWQPYSSRPLTREDDRQILENLTGFFGVLLRWHEEDKPTNEGQLDGAPGDIEDHGKVGELTTTGGDMGTSLQPPPRRQLSKPARKR
jgi:hypothetical protein